jgi:hypothetical protein
MNRFSRLRNERGIALSTVMIVGLVLTMMTGATVTFAVNELDISRHDQNWNAALSAAEAGIDDYIFRVNNNNNYWAYGNNPPVADGNLAFTQWVSVPGAANEGRYRYKVDASHIGTDGKVDLISSGRVGNATRTVRASVRPRAFLDFLYFTDFETLDPYVYGILNFGETEAWANANCIGYKWAPSTPLRHGNCENIQFAGGDVINGPLHSNDAMYIGGNATFNGDVTTNWAGRSCSGVNRRWWWGSGLCAGSRPSPTFKRSSDPAFVENIVMPVTVAELRVKAAAGGCVYKGPTRIVLKSGGLMDVVSPLTAVGSTSPFCSPGTNKAIPNNGVIYVDNAPTSGACASNGKNRLGYPIANDETDYACHTGDVFLQGQLNGRLTIAAKNRIIITNHTTYAPSTDSLLGLIAEQFVEIYHPVTSSGNDLARSTGSSGTPADGGGYFSNAKVHAALLSLRHSFMVQNFNQGSRSNLNDLIIFGAIAQRFRGAVGMAGSPGRGYLKDYTYDQRLKYISPPEFLQPVNSPWQVATWAEVEPQEIPAF